MAVESRQIKVTGMSCAHCVAHVEKAVAALKGVKSVKVDLASSMMSVQFDPGQTGVPAISQAVKEAGYGTA